MLSVRLAVSSAFYASNYWQQLAAFSALYADE